MILKIWNESNKEKFISLVTPVTGRSDLFAETIKSINTQTSKDFEWIITDDTADVKERKKFLNMFKTLPKKIRLFKRHTFLQNPDFTNLKM